MRLRAHSISPFQMTTLDLAYPPGKSSVFAGLRQCPFAMAVMVLVLAWYPASRASTIVTQNDVFYIPFSTTSATPDVTLELYVSGNSGKSWQLYQQQPASAGKFSFRAADDGEFWFSVRVADGRPDAAQTIAGPELKVAVDRAKPVLTAFGARTPSGQVICRWSAEDPHLNPESATVEYQLAGQTDWTQAPTDAIPATNAATPDRVAQGSAVLPGITLEQTIRLRVSVRDDAGNVASTEREYNPAALPLIQDQSSLAVAAAEPGARQLPAVVHAQPHSPAPPGPADQRLPIVVSSNPPNPNDSRPFGWQQSASTHSSNSLASGEPRNPRPRHDESSVELWPASIAASTMPAAPALVGRDTSRPEPTAGNAPPSPRAPGTSYGSAGTIVARQDATGTATTPDTPSLNQRMSRSRRFEFDYDLQDVLPGSVHRVEVWYTQDGGRSWRHHGDDEDCQSPYLMQVDEDGLYGIRLLVQTRVGYNVRPPGSGEPADVWVHVDSTPPVAHITAVEYGHDAAAGQLEIRWELQDPNLAEHPVTLLFSDSPNGPWRKIVGDYPNVGHYRWLMDDRAPPRIFLRLEARDQAGNVAIDSPSTPVNNVRATPRGQILDVRPAARPKSTTVR